MENEKLRRTDISTHKCSARDLAQAHVNSPRLQRVPLTEAEIAFFEAEFPDIGQKLRKRREGILRGYERLRQRALKLIWRARQ
jgi:hypothetical protein